MSRRGNRVPSAIRPVVSPGPTPGPRAPGARDAGRDGAPVPSAKSTRSRHGCGPRIDRCGGPPHPAVVTASTRPDGSWDRQRAGSGRRRRKRPRSANPGSGRSSRRRPARAGGLPPGPSTHRHRHAMPRRADHLCGREPRRSRPHRPSPAAPAAPPRQPRPGRARCARPPARRADLPARCARPRRPPPTARTHVASPRRALSATGRMALGAELLACATMRSQGRCQMTSVWCLG